MVRRTEPDPAAALSALARRLDSLDRQCAHTTAELVRLDQLTADITALGRGLADVTAHLRTLTEPDTHRAGSQAAGSGAGGIGGGRANVREGEAGEPAEEPAGQPNWLTVTDPVTAEAWLSDAASFVADILPMLAPVRIPTCWMLHPAAVVDVIALHQQCEAAYTVADPTGVSELLARWVPVTVRRLTDEVGPCASDRAHHTPTGFTYTLPAPLGPGAVAHWWTDRRHGGPDAMAAFALSRI